MEITKGAKEKDTLIIHIKGKMDAVSSPEFEKNLQDLIDEGENNFIIDLGKLDYISSAGLRSILILSKKLKANDGKLLLADLQDTVQDVFEISGFNTIIPIHESVQAALAQIR